MIIYKGFGDWEELMKQMRMQMGIQMSMQMEMQMEMQMRIQAVIPERPPYGGGRSKIKSQGAGVTADRRKGCLAPLAWSWPAAKGLYPLGTGGHPLPCSLLVEVEVAHCGAYFRLSKFSVPQSLGATSPLTDSMGKTHNRKMQMLFNKAKRGRKVCGKEVTSSCCFAALGM